MAHRQNQAAYDVHDVASAVIRLAIAEGNPLTNLQLQKILYLCQLAYVKEEKQLLFPEEIVAWQYGPVVKASYDEYSYRGASSLRKAHMMKRDWRHDKAIPVTELDDEAMAIIQPIVQAWYRRPLWDLVNESHKKDGPWDRTYNPKGMAAGAGYGCVIDPMKYADAYDPETCSVRVELIADETAGRRTDADGDTDADAVAEEGLIEDVELTVTIPARLVGTLHERAREKNETEAQYVADLVNALLECV